MSDYKCINPYYSERLTKRIAYGEEISSTVYYNLQPSEQAKYTRVIKEDTSSSSSSSMPDYGSSWGSSISDSTPSSDSSSFDFGGGDGGGGGATGDW